ncbi:MAG TPA: sulfotransferase, partial [Stellaceae bacterium]|nr:sulfotransferase [Stellaceae bacterium]
MGTVVDAAQQRARLAALSDPALNQALVDFLRTAVARSTQRRPEDVRLDRVSEDPLPLFLAVRPYVSQSLGLTLLPFDLPHCRSIPEFAAHLARELRMPPAPAAPLSELDPAGWSGTEPPDRRFDAPLERPIVFVLSSPRSGSTLLSAMLGKHPKLYAAGELFLLPFETMGARLRLLGRDGAWVRLGLYAAIIELTGMPEAQAEQECLAMEAKDIPVSAVYRRLQELAGDRTLVDKSPPYASRPDWLACAER